MRILAFCLCISMPLLLTAQRKIDLSSPDGNIIFGFFNENAQAAYSVSYKKQVIVDKSFLSLGAPARALRDRGGAPSVLPQRGGGRHERLGHERPKVLRQQSALPARPPALPRHTAIRLPAGADRPT